MAPEIALRGHHVLCLQQFKGLGYSPEFVANLAELISRLRGQPDAAVRLADSADAICAACPHLVDGSCQDDGTDAERRRGEQDRLALGMLGLRPGDVVSWREIIARLRSMGNAAAQQAVCGECRWLRGGHCQINSGDRRCTP